MGTGSGGHPRIELGETAARADCGEGSGEATLCRDGVVGIGGGDTADVARGGELGEGVVAGGVEGVAVVPQLDEDAVAPERLDQAIELAGCGGRSVGNEGGGDGALAAAGERPGVSGGDTGDVGEGELWCALLPGEMAEADRPGQPGVPTRTVSEEQQVLAMGIGGGGVGNVPGGDLGERLLLASKQFAAKQPTDLGGLRTIGGVQVVSERELGAEDRRHAQLACGLGEADDAVEAVVIGEGEGLEAKPGRLGDQLFGMRSSVEEGEVGVAVQLGVGHRAAARPTPAGMPALRTAGACGSTPGRRRRRSTTASRAPDRHDRERDHGGRRAPTDRCRRCGPTAPPRARSRSNPGC